MNKFKATREQQAIFDFLKNEKGNLVIMARAGAGKTSTIVEALNHISWSAQITFLCFNEHIKQELQSRVPKNVKVYTTHGIGYGAIMRKYKGAKFDENKLSKIINKISKNWKSDLLNEDRYEYFAKLMKITNLAKSTLSLDKTSLQFLCRKYEINTDKEGKDLDRVLKILEKSVEDIKTFDFADMIFLPATDPKIWMFPQDYVFVDEAHDMNRAQQFLINKMLKRDKLKNVTGRFVSVLDNFQAIQGFAGSDNKSFEWFSNRPNTHILPLTYTFRCGKNIVSHANIIVPDIKPLPNAHEGVVREGNVLTEARDGDFILCRKTKPLVVLFFQFLVAKKKAYVKGSDIGDKLIEKTEPFKTKEEMVLSLPKAVEDFKSDLLSKGVFNYQDNYAFNEFKDTAECLLFLAKTVSNLDELKGMIHDLFKDRGEGIVLSTIHKSKGLEADRVFIILSKDTLPYQEVVIDKDDKETLEWIYPLKTQQQWMKDQELNLKYVAITRAKQEFIYDNKWKE